MAYLRIREVAERLKVSRPAIEYQISKGRIPIYSRRKPTLIDERCLDFVATILREHKEKQLAKA